MGGRAGGRAGECAHATPAPVLASRLQSSCTRRRPSSTPEGRLAAPDSAHPPARARSAARSPPGCRQTELSRATRRVSARKRLLSARRECNTHAGKTPAPVQTSPTHAQQRAHMIAHVRAHLPEERAVALERPLALTVGLVVEPHHVATAALGDALGERALVAVVRAARFPGAQQLVLAVHVDPVRVHHHACVHVHVRVRVRAGRRRARGRAAGLAHQSVSMRAREAFTRSPAVPPARAGAFAAAARARRRAPAPHPWPRPRTPTCEWRWPAPARWSTSRAHIAAPRRQLRRPWRARAPLQAGRARWQR